MIFAFDLIIFSDKLLLPRLRDGFETLFEIFPIRARDTVLARKIDRPLSYLSVSIEKLIFEVRRIYR